VGIDATNHNDATLDIQQQVDRLADDLLARGTRPTLQLLSLQLDASGHVLRTALEHWVQRVGAQKSGARELALTQNAVQLVPGFPFQQRRDAMTNAAVAAGLEAANRKEEIKRIERHLELKAEIERARIALTKMEARRSGTNTPAHLVKAIEKARARLVRMEAALDEMPRQALV